jgi:glutamate racemase
VVLRDQEAFRHVDQQEDHHLVEEVIEEDIEEEVLLEEVLHSEEVNDDEVEADSKVLTSTHLDLLTRQ